MLTLSNRLSHKGNRGMCDKHQVTEEPCEAKVSSTVLKARRSGDTPTLANKTKVVNLLAKMFVNVLAIELWK